MIKIGFSFALIVSFLFLASFGVVSSSFVSTQQLPEFEVLMPWGLDHPRGQIIQSMIENHSTLGDGVYNFVYTKVGSDPSDHDNLVKRFLAGDYPNLIIVTQNWYTEFSKFGIWYDFSSDIATWSGDRASWREDIPTGWWSILDKENGNGTGSGIYALPFYGETILPYVNLDDFEEAGLTIFDIDTIDSMLEAAKSLNDAGKTAFAQVGLLQDEIAYFNYMLGSTNNYINASSDPATVFSWENEGKYGVNGSLSVEGLAAYLKLKGEGYVQETVDTDGGVEVNTIFTNGKASMVFVGPWGTDIFLAGGGGLSADTFQAIDMPKSSDDIRSTLIGGGITLVPNIDKFSAQEINDAVILAQWLLEDENQMKTVDNWLEISWRIPVRISITKDPWFIESGHPERANFVKHVESQEYAFPWGKQHPEWISVHESVMMRGYKNALLEVEYGKGYSDNWYLEQAQKALNKMAANIQCFSLGGPCVEVEKPSVNTPGLEITSTALTIVNASMIAFVQRKKKINNKSQEKY